MKEELRPCPFCGGKAKIKEPPDGWPYSVCCVKCGAKIQGESCREDAEQNAVGKWNKRSDKYAFDDCVFTVKREKIESAVSEAAEIYRREMEEYLKNGSFDGRFFTLDFLSKLHPCMATKEKCRIILEYDPAKTSIWAYRLTYSGG